MSRSVVLGLQLALAACVGAAAAPASAQDACTPGKTKKIAFMLKQQTAFRYLNADIPFFKKTAEAAGYEVIVQSAENDAQNQISQAENVITQGVDAIVIQPVDFNVAAGIAEMAAEAKIPLASYDDLILGAAQAGYIGRDPKDGGAAAAQAVVEKKPQGNYVLIGGDAGQTGSTLMQEGYHVVLDPLVEKGDIKIVMDQFTPAWKTEPAQANAENALTANDNKVDAFLVSYDGMSLGVLQAIEAAGIVPGSVLVTGQDMELSSAQAIVEGRQFGSLWPAPDEMAIAGANAAVAMAECKDIGATTTVDNGAGQIPWVKTPIYLVSQDQMGDFVCKHPFWLNIDEVYKNVPDKKTGLLTTRLLTIKDGVSLGFQPEARPAGGAGCAALPIVRMSHITKDFPGVRALADVSLSIAPGEIMALLGANGAGKSTLIQILAGAHPAGSYAGEIEFAGQAFRPASTAEAERAGVALVPQEANVVPELSVAENICLNAEPLRWGMIDVARRLAVARAALQAFDLNVDPTAAMDSVDLATQQLIVIARALSKNARLLILDEPTAALTENESARLFAHMRAMKARGVAVVFVSHRLAEVFAISDRIVVMRDGRIRGDHVTGDVSRQAVVAEMVAEVAGTAARPLTPVRAGPALAIRGFTVLEATGAARPRADRLDLEVHRGEIVGLFGLLGAGCIEAALAIYGAWNGPCHGEVRVDGRPVVIRTPRDAVRLGIGLMAQDRRDCLMQDQSVADNVAIASLGVFSHRGVLDSAGLRRAASDQVSVLRIKTTSIDAAVGALSGGNQQKVQVARWLAAGSRILILIDPTRGVDVGARAEIKRVWRELSAAGQAILLASTDAEELVDICDRVIVMRRGRAIGEVGGAALNERELLRMAADG